MDSRITKSVVIVDRSSEERARQLAEQHDVQVQVPPSRGFEPVSTVTLLLLGSVSAVATVAYLLDKEKGGQIIDLREGAMKSFYRSKDVTYGLVVLVARDGSATVEVKEPKGMFGVIVQALTEALISSMNDQIEKVASIALETVGEDATVHVDQHGNQPGTEQLEP